MCSLLRTEPQPRTRNHVFDALHSALPEPLCTPCKLRTSIDKHCFLFTYESSQESSTERITMDPVRISCSVGFQTSFFLPVSQLFGWILWSGRGRVTSIIVFPSIFWWRVICSPGLLRVAAFAGMGPRRIRRLMSLRGAPIDPQGQVPSFGREYRPRHALESRCRSTSKSLS